VNTPGPINQKYARGNDAPGEAMRPALFLVLLAFTACGGSDTPTEAPIRITPSGLSSSAITIPSGGRVHFFNADIVNHQIVSQDCPDLNTPVLAPGADSLQPLMTGPLSCTFADALTSTAAFNGSVTVNAPGAGGGAGY
jgi:hypothetical protein